MNHQEWAARFKEFMQLSSNDPRRASAELLKLAEESKLAAKRDMSEWHEQQAVSTAAILLENAGYNNEAFQLYQRSLELCKGEALYWTRATAHTLAMIALLHFREGRDDDGVSTAYEALRYFGREPGSEPIFSELIQELGKHQGSSGSCSPV